ncbi:hypothetical protein Hanom_Chr15g01364661 [Helianthus anomalus]
MIQYYGSKFKIQNYGSRYITYHLLQSITLSNQFLYQLSLSKTHFLSLSSMFLQRKKNSPVCFFNAIELSALSL